MTTSLLVSSRALPDAPEVLDSPVGWSGVDAMASCEQMMAAGRSALRVHRTAPTLALSRRDLLRPGAEQARQRGREAGYDPLTRLAGGRVVAYDEGCVIVDLAAPRPAGDLDVERRFREFGQRIAAALASLGVPATEGPVPGEYCPGEHSVSGAGRVKLAGTAQRVTLTAWLCTAVVVVRRAPSLVDVLDAAHASLRYPWDPASVGAVRDFADVEESDVVSALIAELGR